MLWPENGKNALCSSGFHIVYSLPSIFCSWENYSEFRRNYVSQVLPHVDDVNVRKLVNFLTSFGDAVLCTYRKLSHKRVEIECGELAWLCVICAALWKDPEKHFHHLSLSLLARRFESTSNISSSYDIRQHLWQINHASMDGMNGWSSLQVVQTCRVEKIMKLTNRENRISVRWEAVGGGGGWTMEMGKGEKMSLSKPHNYLFFTTLEFWISGCCNGSSVCIVCLVGLCGHLSSLLLWLFCKLRRHFSRHPFLHRSCHRNQIILVVSIEANIISSVGNSIQFHNWRVQISLRYHLSFGNPLNDHFMHGNSLIWQHRRED